MYSNLIDQIESAFYEGFNGGSFSKHGKGYVGKQKPIDVVSLRIDADYIDSSKISSKLKNGILEIKLPKSQNCKTVEISVD